MKPFPAVRFDTHTGALADEGDEIGRILALQQECGKYVVLQTRETVEELLNLGLVFSVTSEHGDLLATVYQQPLDPALEAHDDRQVFKIGGLALAKTAQASKKALFKLLKKLGEHIQSHDLTMITSTTNPIVARLLVQKANCVELSFAACQEQFAHYLALFLTAARPELVPEEYYQDKLLYVRTKQYPAPAL